MKEYGPEHYETDARPKRYKTYLIFHRIKSSASGGDVWDVVKDGVCKAQMAGIGGAQRFIDMQ